MYNIIMCIRHKALKLWILHLSACRLIQVINDPPASNRHDSFTIFFYYGVIGQVWCAVY